MTKKRKMTKMTTLTTMIEYHKGALSVSTQSGTKPPRPPATTVAPTTILYAQASRKPREKRSTMNAETGAAVLVERGQKTTYSHSQLQTLHQLSWKQIPPQLNLRRKHKLSLMAEFKEKIHRGARRLKCSQCKSPFHIQCMTTMRSQANVYL